MGNLFARGVHAAWLASLRRPTNRFLAAVRDPEKAQARKLQAILARHTRTAYGEDHAFGRIATPSQWQAQVPIVDWEQIAPWVERVSQGEEGVLTRDPVLMLEPTAGTTGPPKLLPYTEALLEEFMASTGPWLFQLYRHWPTLLGTRSFWCTSNARATSGHSPGGVPVGASDDVAYFGPIEGWANARITAGVSASAQEPEPPDALMRARQLLQAEDLGFVSLWDPSFIVELIAQIESHLEELLEALPPARATNLRGAINQAGGVTPNALWPHLVVVSCWADAPSEASLEALRRLMPDTPIQPKGLSATEGVVTVPIGDAEGALAAVASHFLEFEDVEAPHQRPRLVHEVQVDACYAPILTTSGGLYRYRLDDVVRCVGHTEATPHFVLEGRRAP